MTLQNPQQQNNKSSDPQVEFSQVRTFFANIISDILDLKHGVDKKATIEEINNKKSLSGANAWMLICSIMIASIGLDRNSPAVIIGAMLISPLMAPILGIGLGVGINDRRVIKTSLMHFSVAILIAILVSTLYFLITPLGTFGSEIQARTEPTILDVLIALFGGVAGIISIARKDISTTIPGVAIATALMPPLCVTGYGLANWQTDVLLSSFYLFFSNTFFICVSTYIIVRVLRFPFRKYPNKKEKRRNLIYVSVFSLIVIIPSLFILNNVMQKIDKNSNIQKMLERQFGPEQEYLDDYKLINNDSLLLLKVYSNFRDPKLEEKCFENLADLGINDMKVKVIYTSEVNLDQIDRLQQKVKSFSRFERFTDSLAAKQDESTRKLLEMQGKMDEMIIDSTEIKVLSKLVQEKYDKIIGVSAGSVQRADLESGKSSEETIVYLEWNEKTRARDKEEAKKNLQALFEGFFRKDRIIIVHR